MSAYIGLAALKEAIGLTGSASDTVDDGVLTSVIFRASAEVDNYLHVIRPGWVGIAAGSNSRASVGSNSRTYDGTGDDTLFIDDASSVESVTVYGTTITATAYKLWPYNETPKRAIIYALPSSSLYGMLTSHWLYGTGNVVVTGYFGLDSIPDDIAQTTLALAILLWRRYQSGEPAPGPTTAQGGSRGVINDPEVLGILEQLWPRWGVPSLGAA